MPDRMEAQTRLHLWLTLLVALAVVAGVGATLIAGRVNPTGPSAGAPSALDGVTRLSTRDIAGLACPGDAAFSPDGARILVLGLLAASITPAACPASLDDSISPAAAGIFDSATGQLVRLIPLSPLVRGPSTGPQSASAHVIYSGLGWSPDGVRVALAFTEFGLGSAAPENVLDSGLLLLDTTTGTSAMLRGDSGFFATSSGVSSGFPVWHLSQQVELPSFLPQPGLAYAWSLDGAPYPIFPLHDSLSQLPIGAGPRYPVGAPDGAPRYTIWQPGLVIGSDGGDIDSRQTAFVSAFPAWSPDGANLTLMVAGVTLSDPNAGARMAGATTMRQVRAAAAITPPLPIPPALPVTPPRDPALAAVQQQVGDLGWAVVGWNPSGSLLASINCAASAEQTMDVRETASGQALERAPLDLAPGDPGCHDGADVAVAGGYPSLGLTLTWAPAGDQLLLCDRAGGTLILYHVRRQPGD